VICTPFRFFFRWAYGHYFALPHTSVCVGFGYRSSFWWSCLPLGLGRKSPRYIYRYLLVNGSMAYGIVLLAPWPLPCCGRMGSVVGLWVGCFWVRLGFFFLEFVRFLYFPCLFTVGVGSFLMGCTSVEGFWFVLLRTVCSSVVSTHSTRRFGVGQGQRVLARGTWDGL